MGALKPGYDVTSEIALVRRLGAGGMGTVWIARHHKLQCDVVVKFLSESLTSDEDACARFSREVTATIQVRSPHVVQTLDHGVTEGGVPYIVMELLEGQDVAKVLRARGHLRPDEVQHIIEGVASALTKAHEHGIVHRDIKPANVFLCTGNPRPFVKLVDFGIAKRLEDETMTATNALLGTPAYMSPEQMGGIGAVDHRTDLWALGVLAFHCLTGAVPFRGAHIANIAHAILNEATPKPTDLKPELPPAIDAWMARALARSADARFASAREMADALALALGDLAYLTTGQLLEMGANPFARVTTNRHGAAPFPSPASGAGLFPPSGAFPASSSGLPFAVPTGYDGVGATLGPSAITHSPYLSSPRLKWWIMGGAAAAVLLIGGAFRVGYGLRREAPAFPPAVEVPPTPVATLPPVPRVIAPPGTVIAPPGTVIAPPLDEPGGAIELDSTPELDPSAAADGTVAPVASTPSARPAPKATARPAATPAARKPARPAGKRAGRADDDDVGF
ncbi:MAG: protein kinase [Labilithrix sp.]|nr:protein kinase [Labilithrix sp.]